MFQNPDAKTRLGLVDGPLAGPGICAQLLVGRQPDSLSPIGVPVEHVGGNVFGGAVTTPGIYANEVTYVQMAAWDCTAWGTSLETVPARQLGRTDTIRVILAGHPTPDGTIPVVPYFNQPAIVPPIPEPAVIALLGVGAVFVGSWRKRRG